MVADTLQQTLMNLQLDRVPLVSLYSHTPSLPLVLVSSPEETQLSAASHDPPCEATPSDGMSPSPGESGVAAIPTSEAAPSEPESQPHPSPNSDPAVATPTMVDMMTPIMEEVDPISNEVTPSSSPPLKSRVQPTSVQDSKTEVKLTNGLSHLEVGRGGDVCVCVCVCARACVHIHACTYGAM